MAAVVALAGLLASGCGGSRTGPRLPAPATAPRPSARVPCSDVFFAGTHNSFAASDEPGWYFANQTYPIPRQLRDGIRAFLIDVHYGVRDPPTAA